MFAFSFGILYTAESEERVLTKIAKKSEKHNWNGLDYGDLIVEVGEQFLGVPYVGGTLDNDKAESCTVLFDKLDCVTYFETTLAIANLIATDTELSMNNIYDEVEYTRYHQGTLDGYTSRLHYTSDWIIDNIEKGIVNDITKSLGGEELDIDVYFMSENSDKYKRLKNNPELVNEISEIEDNINEHSFYYIPKDKIASIESKLQSGDIVALVTSIPGLDYGHIGLINNKNGVANFMHASLAKKKVIIDKSISEYINGVSKFTGITILRPIKPE